MKIRHGIDGWELAQFAFDESTGKNRYWYEHRVTGKTQYLEKPSKHSIKTGER